ncbi:MAG: DNA polymerase III subunit delta [Acidiferrobacterales bacterium]
MKLYPNQLNDHLKKSLAPVYLVSGDDPFLVDEAISAIRNAAKLAGFSEREVWHAERGFDWNNLLESSQSLSLFSQQKMIELRLPTGKPGDQGSKLLTTLAQSPPDQTLLLVVTGKLEASSQRSKWVKALESAGVMITIYPLESRELPAWINQRLKNHGLTAGPGVLDMLAWHFDGNLLAAAQEVEKLALLFKGQLEVDDLSESLSENARFNVFKLTDSCLAGDVIVSSRILRNLKAEAVAPVLVLWALSREARGLGQMARDIQAGKPLEQVLQSHGVWSKRRPAIKAALGRLKPVTCSRLLQRAARTDRVIKGRLPGDAWQTLQDLVLAFCGKRPLAGIRSI